MKNKEWVQCFYSVTFNCMFNDEKSEFAWGFAWFHLKGDCKPLVEQIANEVMKISGINSGDIFNIQVNSFTPFNSDVFEINPNL